MKSKKVRSWFQKSLAVVLSVAFLVTSQGATVLASSTNSVSQNTGSENSETSISSNDVSDNEVSENNTGNQGDREIDNLPILLNKEIASEKNHLSATLAGFDNLEAGIDYVADEVLCEVSSYKEAAQVAQDYDASVQSVQEGLAVLKVTEEVATVLEESVSLENDHKPVYPNYIYTLDPVYSEVVSDSVVSKTDEDLISANDASTQAVISNDPFVDANTQWYHNMIGSKFAWKQGIKGADVQVAVLDTGISTTHQDLVGQYVPGRNFAPDNNSNVNSNLYVDDNGHGSNVSGIIAAKLNNGVGGSGIAPDAKIVPVKVMNADGRGTSATITQGIRYAAGISAVKVMNLSLGGYNQDILYSNAISDATDAGILVVVSAGNDNTSGVAYPAGYKDAFAVSAIGETKKKSSFSNYGSHIKIAAPGGDIKLSANYDGFQEIRGITSCNKGTGNITMIGTSQAAPMVSGAAALIYSKYPELRSANNRTSVGIVRSKLQNSATIIGDAKYFGKGMLNIPKSLEITEKIAAPIPSVVSKSVVASGTTLQFTHELGDDVTIYYTMNGKTPVYNANDATGIFYSPGSSIVLNGNKPITIKAVAYVYGRKSAVATYTYTVQKGLVSSITVNTKNEYNSLAKGKSVQMVANVFPEHAKNKAVTWSIVGEQTIAKISSTGVLTGLKTGTIEVKAVAKDGSGVESSVRAITITNPVYSLKLQEPDKKITMSNKDTRTLAAPTISAKDPTLGVPAAGVTYKSSEPKVATVDVNGKITALKSGNTIITVTAKDGTKKYDTCTVTVKTGVTSIDFAFDQANFRVGVGKTRKTNIAFNGGLTKPDNRGVIYTSDDPTIAKISSTGVITGVSKGNTILTVTSKDNPAIQDWLVVTVVDLTQGITLSIDAPTSDDVYTIPSTQTTPKSSISCTLYECEVPGSFDSSEYLALNMAVTPATGTMDLYSYSSSNSSIVSVNKETGKFIALKNGTAIITVKALDGSGKTASCKITVKQQIHQVALRTSNGTMGVAGGKSLQLSKVTLPYNAGQNVAYFFLDGSYLKPELGGNKITNTGLLTAKSVKQQTTVDVLVMFNYKIEQGFFTRRYVPEVYKIYPITIYPATKSIAFAYDPGSKFTLAKGAMYKLTDNGDSLIYSPTDCQRIVKYTSSNPKVATVDSNGTIKALSKGTTVIKATAIDGTGVSKSTTLTVTE